MRPIRRGNSPQIGSFQPYTEAKKHLLERIGHYCSYCERRIETNLAVEHILAKSIPAHAGLEGEWTNFLLACVNCNSTKGNKNTPLNDLLLPDRDNTLLAFDYCLNGTLKVAGNLPSSVAANASKTLDVTGLDKAISQVFDSNGKQIVVDRISKRIETYGIARRAADILSRNPNDDMRDIIVELAKATGGFSIWINVFKDNTLMLGELIDAHVGARESGCFDVTTQSPIAPHPNLDGLAPGGRI